MKVWDKIKPNMPGAGKPAAVNDNDDALCAAPQILDADKMRALFGAHRYLGMYWYNFDTQSWNTNIFHGCKSYDAAGDAKLANLFKREIESKPEFLMTDVCGVAFLCTFAAQYRPFTIVNAPENVPYGVDIAATVVTRDRYTGRINPALDKWVIGNREWFETMFSVLNNAVPEMLKSKGFIKSLQHAQRNIQRI